MACRSGTLRKEIGAFHHWASGTPVSERTLQTTVTPPENIETSSQVKDSQWTDLRN
jgi:hypothetical protein